MPQHTRTGNGSDVSNCEKLEKENSELEKKLSETVSTREQHLSIQCELLRKRVEELESINSQLHLVCSKSDEEVARELSELRNKYWDLCGKDGRQIIEIESLRALLVEAEIAMTSIGELECKNIGNFKKPHCAVCGFYETHTKIREAIR